MSFYSFYKILKEQVAIRYNPPKDPEMLMADFYMIAYLRTLDTSDKSIIGGQTSNIKNRDYKVTIEYVSEELMSYMKPTMLEVVFYALSSEIKHITTGKCGELTDGIEIEDYEGMVRMLVETEGEKFHGVDKDFLIGYLENLRILKLNYTNVTTFDDEDKYGVLDHDERFERGDLPKKALNRTRLSYKSLKKTIKDNNKTDVWAVNQMKIIFDEWDWYPAYGGEAWGRICDGYIRLYFAKTIDSQFVAIDHIYDLQHNTSTVFNKLGVYASSDGIDAYDWIGDFLDMKRNARHMGELLESCSPPIAKLAIAVLRNENREDPLLDKGIKRRQENRKEEIRQKRHEERVREFENDIDKLQNTKLDDLPQVEFGIQI